MKDNKFILVTNDDGIDSPGIRAAVEAVLPLGDILVVAPKYNSSGLGQSIPFGEEFSVEETKIKIGSNTVTGFVIDTAPAQGILYALTNILDRTPDLVVSGINYGVNIGFGIGISGTVGAALEASRFGIKGLAVSFEVPYKTPNDSILIDFSVATHFTNYFAKKLLHIPKLEGVDVLKVDIPSDATKVTAWKVTRSSRQSYWVVDPTSKNMASTKSRIRLKPHIDIETLEPDSDTYAVIVKRVISVTPLSVDMTARIDPEELQSKN